MAPKMIISGAPASGKGTQCELITEKYKLVHVSSGNLLRAAIKEGNELGKFAKTFIDGGKLVPDKVVIDLIKKRLEEKDCKEQGWILDGFPRTGPQAEALKAAGVTIDHFIEMDVPLSVLVQRVVTRRIHPETGKIYNLTRDKKLLEEDKELAKKLIHRTDDNEETCKRRYENYMENFNAIASFYEGKRTKIDGDREKNEIFREVSKLIEGCKK